MVRSPCRLGRAAKGARALPFPFLPAAAGCTCAKMRRARAARQRRRLAPPCCAAPTTAAMWCWTAAAWRRRTGAGGWTWRSSASATKVRGAPQPFIHSYIDWDWHLGCQEHGDAAEHAGALSPWPACSSGASCRGRQLMDGAGPVAPPLLSLHGEEPCPRACMLAKWRWVPTATTTRCCQQQVSMHA